MIDRRISSTEINHTGIGSVKVSLPFLMSAGTGKIK
jgi:hypothetical protein